LGVFARVVFGHGLWCIWHLRCVAHLYCWILFGFYRKMLTLLRCAFYLSSGLMHLQRFFRYLERCSAELLQLKSATQRKL